MRLRGGRLSILGACCLFLASRIGVFAEPALFVEDFQGEEPLANWVISKSSKYAGQPVLVKSANITGFESENTMLLERANQHYGVALPFNTPVDNKDKPFVVQYEVKMDEPLTCGGAYIKLLEESATAKLADFDNDTPYVIMFGPDKCGATNKVHFILRHQNPVTGEWQEKHAKATPAIKVDRKSNLYTLIIRPDNTFEIQVNGVSEKKGSLLEDMDPPVNPAEEIDDPEDSKPDDWVDEAKIADPNASKPEDWDEDAPMTIPDMDAAKPAGWLDDEPDEVADPEASKPEDWDEEEDGEWEAPLVPNPKCEEGPGCGVWVRPTKANPAYKGKWTAPLIDNPAYKGVWAPRKIRNPAFFTDLHPHNLPKMGALAVEIWTTNSGLRFDNFWVGHSEEAAAQYAQDTWKAKFEAEKAAEEEAKKEFSKKEREGKMSQGGWRNLAEVYGAEVVDYILAKPAAAIGTLIALLTGFAFLLMRPSKEEAERPKSTDDDEPAAPQDAGVEEKKGADKKDEPQEEEDDEDEDDK